MKNNNKILLVGGGTAGSVTPLLAIAQELKTQGGFEFLFVGTKQGIEKEMVKKAGLKYQAIISGKLRRYFSFNNFLDFFKIFFAFWQSLFLIIKYQPVFILSAGSFVAVPVIWAGWVLRKKILIHQQDIVPGLANKLMAPFATVITVTFDKSLADYGVKAVLTGNPGQSSIVENKLSAEKIKEKFKLKNNFPTILITGGGTGAEAINKLVAESLSELTSFCQIIHTTGKGKKVFSEAINYHQFEFLSAEEMFEALRIADLVVSRAGLGALTEISLAGKPAIIIPMPNSHQEANANYFAEKEAVIYLDQQALDKKAFIETIKTVLTNKELSYRLSQNVPLMIKADASKKILEIINKII